MLLHSTIPVRQKERGEMLPAQLPLPLAYRQNRPPETVETLAPAVQAGQHYYVQLKPLYENARGNSVPRLVSAGQSSRCFQAEQFVWEMRSCSLSLFIVGHDAIDCQICSILPQVGQKHTP